MTRGLYIHVPFCARACPYCDFDFVVERNPNVDAYLHALDREWERVGPAWTTRNWHTVYIGGGTPSALGAEGLARLVDWVDDRVDCDGTVEFTVELNPEHASPAILDMLEHSRVNRASLGVQSLTRTGLVQLGRLHRTAEATEAITNLRSRGLRVSVDLIVGWPGQSQSGLDTESRALCAARPDHVSIYGLTIEDETPWPKLVERGLRELPDADEQTERLTQARRRLVEAGFEHYEVSNYARPGAQARHNSLYWSWNDYLGLGPSASSARHATDGSVTRWTNPRGYSNWSTMTAGEANIERLTGERAASEGLWLALRRLPGFRLERFLQHFSGVDRAWVERKLARQIDLGNVQWGSEDRIALAPGRWLWHGVVGESLLG